MKLSALMAMMLLLPFIAVGGAYAAARVADRVAAGPSPQIQWAVAIILAGMMIARAARAWAVEERLHAALLFIAAGAWLLVPMARRLGRAQRPSN